jgi:hypothetical protein
LTEEAKTKPADPGLVMSSLGGIGLVQDFPKVECPFVRKSFPVNKEHWKKYGASLGLRNPEVYLATPEIAPGYEWVLEHPATTAVEKLHGTNLAVVTKNGRLVHLQNRQNPIDFLQIMGGKSFLVEGIFAAAGRDYLESDGLQFGECLGPKLNGNLYELDQHLWYPFAKARESLKYASFHKHEKTYDNLSKWFQHFLKSMLYSRLNKIPISKMFSDERVPFAEGVIFYNDEVSSAPGKPRMAKLRRDMFAWFYTDKVEILWPEGPPKWAIRVGG